MLTTYWPSPGEDNTVRPEMVERVRDFIAEVEEGLWSAAVALTSSHMLFSRLAEPQRSSA